MPVDDQRSLRVHVSRIIFYAPLKYPEEDSASHRPSFLLWLLVGELLWRVSWILCNYIVVARENLLKKESTILLVNGIDMMWKLSIEITVIYSILIADKTHIVSKISNEQWAVNK